MARRVFSRPRGIWSLSAHSGLSQAVELANLWVHDLALLHAPKGPA